MKSHRRFSGLVMSLLLPVVIARAQFVTPSSYTANAGATGSGPGYVGPYNDKTGGQLTDGIIGADAWNADLGHGAAYEWLGWRDTTPAMTFNFSSSYTITTVQIGFNRGESTGTIYLPSSVNIGGTSFAVSGSAIANDTRGYLSFTGSWAVSSGSPLQIEFPTIGASYNFVDEVRFSTSAIPEPGATSALTALAVLGFVGWRIHRGREHRATTRHPPRPDQ